MFSQGVVHWRIRTGLWQMRGKIVDIEPLILPVLVVLSQLIIKVQLGHLLAHLDPSSTY